MVASVSNFTSHIVSIHTSTDVHSFPLLPPVTASRDSPVPILSSSPCPPLALHSRSVNSRRRQRKSEERATARGYRLLAGDWHISPGVRQSGLCARLTALPLYIPLLARAIIVMRRRELGLGGRTGGKGSRVRRRYAGEQRERERLGGRRARAEGKK